MRGCGAEPHGLGGVELSSLYVHFPFCLGKCGYCDFLSFVGLDERWEAYGEALLRELRGIRVDGGMASVYLGGGTPTVLTAGILARVLAEIPVAKEITCEANPGTLTAEKIAVLKEGGVNRISLGLQAWQDRILQAVGRRGNAAEFVQNFYDLRAAGFENINVDVMFGLPTQSMDDWQETLQNITDLQPEHISAYAFTPEVVDDETDRAMYHFCKDFLRERGFMQYELSNFCRMGKESLHNVLCWQRKPYIGVGLGAHSFDGKARWHNSTDLQHYITGSEREEYQEIDKTSAMAEFMFLGLRLTAGVSHEDFYNEFGKFPMEIYGDWLKKTEAMGLTTTKNNHTTLTDQGMDLANQVMTGFLE